jgi:hypothetical protein
VAPFLVLPCKHQGAIGKGVRLLQAASQQMCLTQGETTERLKELYSHCRRLFHRLGEQRYGVSDAPLQSIRLIVTLELVDSAEVEVRQRVQGDLPAGRGKGEDALRSGASLSICAPEVEMDCQKDRDPSQATRVVENRRQGLSFVQSRQDTPKVDRGPERRAQGEPQIKGLLAHVARLRQMWEGAECLLEILCSLAVGGPRYRLLSCLPAVRQGLVPHLAPQGMMGQTFDLLDYPVPSKRLKGFNDAGVQHSPPF